MYINAIKSITDGITAYSEDRSAWIRKLPYPTTAHYNALRNVNVVALKWLTAPERNVVTRSDYLDTVLFQDALQQRITDDDTAQQRDANVYSAFPWVKALFELDEAVRTFAFPSGLDAAKKLRVIQGGLNYSIQQIDQLNLDAIIDRLRHLLPLLDDALTHCWTFMGGYCPDFSWWCAQPVAEVKGLIKDFRDRLEIHVGETLIGAPVGKTVLEQHLDAAYISHSVEELLVAAQREWDWCKRQCESIISELGVLSWADALEYCKVRAGAPGSHIQTVAEMAFEAADYVIGNDLLTVDASAYGTWRMEMMSADMQRTNPFFLGGETIYVSYPTSEMDTERKLMSMRGNNAAFSRATVQHELIPGHHMQQWANRRFNTHRQAWWTPFWVEGWTLHWEMLLWERRYARTAEERCGMLFWRMHRCARVLFSLRFHLGEMSATECVDFLVKECGHEPANAQAEIRRSVGDQYPPLYQLAYQIGGLQVRALSRELVANGWSLKAFHDRFLMENEMPIAALRALLIGLPLDGKSLRQWRFLDSHLVYSD